MVTDHLFANIPYHHRLQKFLLVFWGPFLGFFFLDLVTVLSSGEKCRDIYISISGYSASVGLHIWITCSILVTLDKNLASWNLKCTQSTNGQNKTMIQSLNKLDFSQNNVFRRVFKSFHYLLISYKVVGNRYMFFCFTGWSGDRKKEILLLFAFASHIFKKFPHFSLSSCISSDISRGPLTSNPVRLTHIFDFQVQKCQDFQEPKMEFWFLIIVQFTFIT